MNAAVEGWLVDVGVPQMAAGFGVRVVWLAAVLVLAWVADLIAKRVLLRLVSHAIEKSKTKLDNILLEKKVFARLSHIASGVVIYLTAPIVFGGYARTVSFMKVLAGIYMVGIGLLVVNALLNSVVDIYRTFTFARKMPIKSFVQVVKIVVYVSAGIVIVSIILKKDPTKLLAGLGALTAVSMLIFKDSILGFVAGIQLTTNEMVHIGDWIEMPKYGADGDVIDISLTTVKVQNWDKTVATIPTYALISDSFKNWRGMSESGGRRIKRSINIDMTSVRFCDEATLNKFKRFQYISDYIDAKREELTQWNADEHVDDSELVNGRRLTNIGTFRAYIVAYLKHHPQINKDMTFLIRHLEPTSKGLPVQIYVFSSDKAWANYEAIQADIFDHIMAVIPEFGLRVFQEPTGADFQRLSGE
jgi:miniconductance mechanosensitive channel